MRIDDGGALSAPYTLEYTYQRSTGPVIGRFLGGLRAGRLAGVRTASGRVLVPPLEYDPDTGEPTGAEVEVGPGGAVTTWAWVAQPRRFQPLARPFAWALIKLDGADTAMLHAVDAGSPEAMRTGMRVTARWRSERTGSIRDIEAFIPEPAPSPRRGEGGGGGRHAEAETDVTPVPLLPCPVRLDYTVTAGQHLSSFLRALAARRVIGGRCPACTKVYVPPRGGCPTCGVPTADEVELADTGIITTFCVIRIPFDAAPFPPPYVAVAVLLDGASIPIFHLVRGVAPEEVRMGMRVRAVWVADAELAPTLSSIRWFEPTGEPDAAFESFEEHL